MKTLKIIATTIIGLVVAALPIVSMYYAYGFISPESALAKILTLGLFWFGGATVTILTIGFSGVISLAMIEDIKKGRV